MIFAFIRGEALRGETVSEKNAAPPWLRIRGTLIGNMADYFSLYLITYFIENLVI